MKTFLTIFLCLIATATADAQIWNHSNAASRVNGAGQLEVTETALAILYPAAYRQIFEAGTHTSVTVTATAAELRGGVFAIAQNRRGLKPLTELRIEHVWSAGVPELRHVARCGSLQLVGPLASPGDRMTVTAMVTAVSGDVNTWSVDFTVNGALIGSGTVQALNTRPVFTGLKPGTYSTDSMVAN